MMVLYIYVSQWGDNFNLCDNFKKHKGDDQMLPLSLILFGFEVSSPTCQSK